MRSNRISIFTVVKRNMLPKAFESRMFLRLASTLAPPMRNSPFLVIQIRPEPALDFGDGQAFAKVVVVHLVAIQFADGKIF